MIGFLSLMIVTPMLTSNKELFAIYCTCLSLTTFLSYADLGFISASAKFASESIGKGEKLEAISIIGLSVWFSILAGIIFALFIGLVAWKPCLVFKDIQAGESTRIASNLLMILSFSSLNLIIQRNIIAIFAIRLEEYIPRRISLAFHIVTIFSVFWFFRAGHQEITGYYLFSQVGLFATTIICIALIIKRYGYKWQDLVRSVRFNRDIFRRTKRLAFSSLLGMVGWILYYEMDTLFIAKFIGYTSLAYFALAATIINFIRGILGVFYSPFQARFNHFIGQQNENGLKNLYGKLIVLSKPFILFTGISIFSLMGFLINAWIGPAYKESVLLCRVLLLIYFFSYFQYPSGMLLFAQSRTSEMNALIICNTIIFWVGTLLTYKNLGVLAPVLFKAVTFIVSGIYHFIQSSKYLDIRIVRFARESYAPLVIPALLQVAFLELIKSSLILETGKVYLLIIVAVGALATMLAIFAHYLTSKSFMSSLEALSLFRRKG